MHAICQRDNVFLEKYPMLCTFLFLSLKALCFSTNLNGSNIVIVNNQNKDYENSNKTKYGCDQCIDDIMF